MHDNWTFFFLFSEGINEEHSGCAFVNVYAYIHADWI